MCDSLSCDAMRARLHLAASLCAGVLLSVCSTGPELDVKIDESPQGAVYLKRISDGSLQAAHPIKIDSGTISLLLSGILVREQQPAPNTSFGGSDSRPVFSGSEVAYLAPLISEGLRRAASDQQVGFRTGHPGPSQQSGVSMPSTTALLYAYGRSLYVTLTQYHAREDAATMTKIPNSKSADTSGLTNHTLSFIPESAKRPDTYLDARSTDKTLVIDYQLLAALPPVSIPSASTQPTSQPAAPQAATEGKAESPKKDSEIEALRKELQEIKKQLAEQEAERARSQQKNAVPQK